MGVGQFAICVKMGEYSVDVRDFFGSNSKGMQKLRTLKVGGVFMES